MRMPVLFRPFTWSLWKAMFRTSVSGSLTMQRPAVMKGAGSPSLLYGTGSFLRST